MGTGRRRRGVELRERSIRVHFTWNGERCRETLEWKPTEAHANAAARLVDEIRSRIELGTFTAADYAQYFPTSERAAAARAAADAKAEAARAALPTFSTYAKRYREARLGDGNQELAPATKSQYDNELKRWEARIGAAKPMHEIEHSWLAGIVGKVEFPSARMRNNSLIPLRGVFDMWVADAPRERTSPLDGVGNAAVQKKKPDPLDRDETEAILARMEKQYDPRVWAYYEAAFFSGMRPEEQIALRWSKLDFRRGMVKIDVVRTFKGGEKETKTYKEREFEMNTRSRAAFERMRQWTALKPHGHVFENPVTGKPWHDERSQRDHYWKPTLLRLGIRDRRAYATRASYATMCLMAGMNPGWVAEQLGHDLKEFFASYAKWINQADKGREMKKLEAELARPITEEKSA